MKDREYLIDRLEEAEEGNGFEQEDAMELKKYILDLEDALVSVLEATNKADVIIDSWNGGGDYVYYLEDEDMH